MIGKVISGGSFGGTVGYVMKEPSRVLEASPKRLSKLEALFETEQDQRRIDSMRKGIEKYEQLVRRRAALDEQARLKAQEAEQLNRDAAKLKNK